MLIRPVESFDENSCYELRFPDSLARFFAEGNKNREIRRNFLPALIHRGMKSSPTSNLDESSFVDSGEGRERRGMFEWKLSGLIGGKQYRKGERDWKIMYVPCTSFCRLEGGWESLKGDELFYTFLLRNCGVSRELERRPTFHLSQRVNFVRDLCVFRWLAMRKFAKRTRNGTRCNFVKRER